MTFASEKEPDGIYMSKKINNGSRTKYNYATTMTTWNMVSCKKIILPWKHIKSITVTFCEININQTLKVFRCDMHINVKETALATFQQHCNKNTVF